MKYRLLLALAILAIALSGCISLAEDITPPPGYQSPTPAPTLGNLFPPAAPDLAAGASIYAQKCAACHGEKGLGDGPQAKQLTVNVPALGVPEIARRAAPSDWYTTITRGRIQNFMPPFSSLTDQQRWDVLAYAFSLSTTPELLAQGQALYATNCTECHGVDGKKAPGADLTSQEALSRLTQNDLFGFVKKGLKQGADVTMPPSNLADNEIYAVVAYIRTFTLIQPESAATPEPPATPTPPTPNAASADSATPGTPVATAAQPANLGSISGKVSSPGGKLPSDLVLTLHGFSHDQTDSASTGPQEVITLTLTPSSDGSYKAENVELGENRFFLVETQYQGVSYQTEVGISEAGKTEMVLPDLVIYETTEDTSNLTLNQLHLFVNAPANNIINMYALYVFTNASDKAVGVSMDAQERIPFVKIPEVAVADSLAYEDAQMGASFMQYNETGFAMIPTDKQYGIAASFNLPYDKQVEISQPIAVTAKTVSILVPEGMTITGDGLTDGGVQSMQGGQNFQIYSTSGEVKSGSALNFTISGEPKASSGTTGTTQAPATTDSNQTTLVIAVAAFGVVLIVAGLYLFWRDRNRSARDDDFEDDDFEDEENDDLDLNVEEIMDAIIALDEQYKAQNITEEAYQQRRAELKARLKGKVK